MVKLGVPCDFSLLSCCWRRPLRVGLHKQNPAQHAAPCLPAALQAIDLVDEAAAKLKMEITSKPLALDEIDRKVLQVRGNRERQ